MRFRSSLAANTSLLALTVASAFVLTPGAANAQSSGTLQIEEMVVSSRRINENLAGLMAEEQVAKSRSSVTQEYLETQQAGQSIMQSINLLPGVNFTNNDPYGSSGGNIRLRSFDGNRVSVTFDGVPLNDSGNYAIFTNQLLDPEIIERTTVNLGTTDVDSPTASATGGTVNIQSRRPSDTLKFTLAPSYGSNNYRRFFGSVDSGAFGPWDTTAFMAVSYQKYDKFKGPGSLEKWQINGKVLQEWGDKNFVSLGVHYNRNRNNAYRGVSLAEIAQFGYFFDYFASCGTDAPTAGVADNENAGIANDPSSTASCINYIGHRINPSNTGNIRMQSSFALTDTLRLNVDPSYQYVLATGGTATTAIAENTGRLRGAGTIATQPGGVDLNGDGDLLDTIRLYGPSVTNTHRYGVTASVIWQALEDHVVRVAYTLDYGRHRQTGEYARLLASGDPIALFPGRDGRLGVQSVDGVDLRFRDRFSIASLNQVAANYDGKFFDGIVRVSAGLRAPYFHRELNQYCYTQTPNTAYCTTQTPGTPDANGFVNFPAPASGAATRYLPPFAGTKNYDKILPNAGIVLRPFGEDHSFYVSYAEGLSAPRTDNLYTAVPIGVQPETTKSYDLGYRFQTPGFMATATVWKTDFDNRIVTSFDPVLLTSLDRNVGPVEIWGVDGEVGTSPFEDFTVYGSFSYNHSKVLNNIAFNATTTTPTAGKRLVETPDWTFSVRGEYKIDAWTLGAQLKYVGDRFATDVNDELAPSYTLVDANLRYDLAGLGLDTAYFQLNVSNIFDKKYLGSISTRVAANPATPGFSGAPTYNVGAPRTVQGSLHIEF
ncbi:MAG: TonB-dependent receptor [Rhodospirillaceae bacterium]|nr:TonB-dependent receptor [Rhodospirillaceae bacterium]